jgi:hypothetical protein
MIDHFMKMSKGDPARMQELLDTPKVGDALRAGLDPSQYARLTKITRIGNAIARGDEEALLPRWYGGPVTIAARILGAKLGRVVAPGQLQAPSIFSDRFKRVAEKIFKVNTPDDMIAKAVMDAKWEQLLYSREPRTTKEFRAITKQLIRNLSATQGALSAWKGSDDGNE